MTKYDNFSRDELIELLQKQDKELARKKYGLVWDSEKEPEQVVLDCAKKLPILKNITEKDIKTNDDDYNIMIEGDNYHALQVLNYTHKGKIDVIYIDPPYNTGNKDFVYNDKYVDKEDGYRHSKWLNFMEKRLELAKKLLNTEGIISLSINEIEHSNLKLLLNKIFGEKNFVANIPTIMNLKGNNDNFGFSDTHEYTLIYAKDKTKCTINLFDVDEDDLNTWQEDDYGLFKKADTLRRTGQDAPRVKRPKGWFPVFINENTHRIYVTDDNLPLDENDTILYPINDEGVELSWSWSKTKITNESYNLILTTAKDGGYNIYKKQRPQIGDLPTKKPKTLFYKAEYSTSTATNELKKILGKKIFNNPKPVPLIKDLVFLTGKKNALILDFFAGSGTTGHAVLEQNKQDGGNRKFILCTNNEGNIATEVCYPRIEKVIQGYNKNGNGEFVEGLGGNIKYFKTDFVTNSKNKTQTKINLAKQCSEMLCLKTGSYNLIDESTSCFKIFDNNKHNRFLCVYFDLFDENMEQFITKIKKLDGEKLIFMFSLDENVDKSQFEKIENVKIEPIPQKILDVYKKIAKEHIKGDDYD